MTFPIIPDIKYIIGRGILLNNYEFLREKSISSYLILVFPKSISYSIEVKEYSVFLY